MDTVPVPPAAGIISLPEVSVRLQRTNGEGAVEVVAEEPQAVAATAAMTASAASEAVEKRRRAKRLG